MAAADWIPYLHRVLKQRQTMALWEGDRTQPQIALTFDDGPHPLHTPPLLEALARYSIKATFFWLGAWVERYPAIARSVYEHGHWLGLHSYHHRAFIGQSAHNIRMTLAKTQQAIAQACQISPERIIDVRPPYGICFNQTLQHLKHWGYRPVMWSIVPVDWTTPGIHIITERVLKQTRSGDIIVLHDGPSGGESVAAITQNIVPPLQDQGLEFVTIDALWQSQPKSSSTHESR